MTSLFQLVILLVILATIHVLADDEAVDESNSMNTVCKENLELDEFELPAPGNPKATRTCIESTVPDYDGMRCFYTYVPECAGENSPLVFDIHGLRSCPYHIASYSGWATKATENCFVLVMPQGNTSPKIATNSCWALPGGLADETVDDFTADPCCCTKPDSIGIVEPSETDDAKFLRQVASTVVDDVKESSSSAVTIDTKRIYFAGHSNGCFTSIYMAATFPDMVTAVACHSGLAIAPFPPSYIPTPIWKVHGRWDPVVPYNGNPVFRGQLSTHDIIANNNGCTETNEIFDESTDNKYSILTSSSCTNNATVVLMSIKRVDHLPYLGMGSFFTDDVVVDTTQMAWDFLKPYSLSDPPNFDDDGPPTCEDDKSFFYELTNGKRKKCFWVGKNSVKRCYLVQDGKEVKDLCPLSCGVCGREPCEDDSSFEYIMGSKSKSCSWVKKNPSKRCKKRQDGKQLKEYCRNSCNNCPLIQSSE